MIRDSIALAKARKGEAMYDAEHFFDGYKANPDYALSCVTAAAEAGARWVVLCDTNGGTLPHEIYRYRLRRSRKRCRATGWASTPTTTPSNAVANSLAAIRAGARQVQGTINGLGERCGNANIISLIPSLIAEDGV